MVSFPWYRRIWRRLFHPRTREAGWRPRRVGPPNVFGAVFRLVRLAVLALIAVGLLAFLLVPPFRSLVVDKATAAFTTVRKVVNPHYDAVHATGASASSFIAGHPPALAIDDYKTTYWAASASDKAPVLVLTFSGPVDLSKISFNSGSSGPTPADAYLNQPRPKLVHVVFSDGTSKDITLGDQSADQFTDIDAKQVTRVEIHILSTYPPTGASVSSVAISNVEFKTKD